MRKISKLLIFSIAFIFICPLSNTAFMAVPKNPETSKVSNQNIPKNSSKKANTVNESTKKTTAQPPAKSNNTKKIDNNKNTSDKTSTSPKETAKKSTKKPSNETAKKAEAKPVESENKKGSPETEIPSEKTSPGDWKIVTDDTNSGEGFSAIQKNSPLVGSINDGNFLLVAGIVLICFSVVGISFFIYLLVKKKPSGSHFKK